MDERVPKMIRLPPELEEWLRRRAFETGQSQNTIVVEAIAEKRDRLVAKGAKGTTGHGRINGVE